MTDRKAQAKLLPTPFVASFIGSCRKGELTDTDPVRRSAAWGNWAIDSLDTFKGLSDREYVGLVLPGKFYAPSGTGPWIRRHLEIPSWVLERPDAEFPDRLAAAGMAILFPWWLVPEVTAVKRALLTVRKGSVSGVLSALRARRHGLEAAYRKVESDVRANWDLFEGLLAASPESLVDDICGSFSTEDVAEVLAPAAGLQLVIEFDAKLRSSQGDRSARRVGVWQISGQGVDGAFSLGVVTPRLTANSVFRDRLFDIANESDAALLVRLLVLRRLAAQHLTGDLTGTVALDPSELVGSRPYLRAVVARVGAKLPEASDSAVVNFLQTYPDPAAAWGALEAWAGSKYLLTVTRESFEAAHETAIQRVRRAETPRRSDIDVVLPLAWYDGKVVRVTFSRGDSDQ